MIKNTKHEYGKVTIILHWLFAVAVIALIIVGLSLDSIPKESKPIFITLHKATGFTLLWLGLFRWYWMLSNETPSPLPNFSKAEIGISHATKYLLMVLIILMPISGWMMSMYAGHGINYFGLFEIPALVEKNKEIGKIFHEVHEISGYTLIVVLALHMAAAIKHHLIDKDDTLNRMLGR